MLGRRLRRRLRVRAGARRARRHYRSAAAVLDRGGAEPRATACYGLFVLPESLPPERRVAVRVAARQSGRLARAAALASAALLGARAASTSSTILAHASLPSIGVLYMMYRYGWDERTVGFTMAGVGLCAMVVQGGLIGPTVARFGERATLIIGLAFGDRRLRALGFAPNRRWCSGSAFRSCRCGGSRTRPRSA